MNTYLEKNVASESSNTEKNISRTKVGFTSGKERWFNVIGTIKSLITLTD